MRAVKAILLIFVIASAFGADDNDAGTISNNEIGEDEGRSTQGGLDYEPSFLGDILGPDYFESDKASVEKTTEVTAGGYQEEPEVVTKRGPCMGCPMDVSEQNLNDKKFQDLANFAVETYASENSNGGEEDSEGGSLRITRLRKVQTQVVAGFKYIMELEAGYYNCTKAQYEADPPSCALIPGKPIISCKFEVLEQAWKGLKEVRSSECQEVQSDDGSQDIEETTTTRYHPEAYETEEEITSRKKREADDNGFGILRQPEENEKDLKDMAIAALEQLDTIDEDNDARVLVEVLNVKKQTVSGWLYHLKLRVAQTTCAEGKHATLEQCKDKLQLPFLICDVKVLFQPWQTVQKKVTESQCFPEKMKMSKKTAKKLFGDEFKKNKNKLKKMKKVDPGVAVGGPKEVDPNSPEIAALMDWAVESLDAQSNALHAQKLVKVIHAERQLVSGIMNRVTFETGYTTCRKNSIPDRSVCQLDESREHNFCEMHIWEKPWLHEKRVTYSKCGKKEEILKRKKRSLIGGDDHDSQPHGRRPLIGGDDHDSQPHGRRPLIGGDDHDYQPHNKRPVIGGDDHDYQPHKKRPLIGGDDHDYQPHSKRPLIGGDDHDYQAHQTRAPLGGDDHDSNGQLAAKFEEFKKRYGKKYASEEEHLFRLGVFKENMKKVKLLQETEQGTATYGATMFADLTEEEFSRHYLGLRPDLRQRNKVKKAKVPPVVQLPDEFDWRHYNAVTPVKNQGMCGSCWAFSVTGNIEGLYAKKHQQLLSFSEQELVDCDTLDEGCGGGLPENAYKALQKLGGLETEQAYPYDGKNDKCHFKSDLAKAQVTGFVELPKNETLLASWLLKNGPVSIGINANAMQFYFGGVSHPWKFLCSPKQLDHGVLIVGYGVHTTSIRHKTMPYWLVKNSWGPHWGEQGYYRVYRGDGTCGLNQMATSAVIA